MSNVATDRIVHRNRVHRRCAALLLASLCVGSARAGAADAAACVGIADDADRLRCYDRAHARPPQEPAVPAPPVAAAPPSPERSTWERRIVADAERDTFTLTGLRPSYLLYTASRSPNREPYRFLGASEQISSREVKLQLSLQTKAADNLFGDNGDLWLAYTQVAYWQVPNDALSSPFRESNHEPEAYVSFLTDYRLLGWTGRSIALGVAHQSNGQSKPLSRSWNRVFANFVFARGDYALAVRPWLRIREDVEDDDNPNIEDYLGNYEIRLLYESGRHQFSLMGRNLTRRYNAELGWSFRIAGRLRGLVQLTSGHGENLIDHDHKNHRLGIGILMSDWL